MAEPIQTKQCSRCKQIKPISEFSKCRRDGLQAYCKSCQMICLKKYRKTSKGKVVHRKENKKYKKTPKGKAAEKRYRQSEKGKAANLKGQKKHRKTEKGKATKKRFNARHPNHRKAENAVNNAVAIGKLPWSDTLQCHYCLEKAEQYHHHKGYAPEHWLDVVPVCIPCHNKIHKKTA